jgi:hypothetical protein
MIWAWRDTFMLHDFFLRALGHFTARIISIYTPAHYVRGPFFRLRFDDQQVLSTLRLADLEEDEPAKEYIFLWQVCTTRRGSRVLAFTSAVVAGEGEIQLHVT